MNTLPFCSRNPDYKAPFGAVKAGEPVTYRLLLHRDALCEAAFLLLRRDGEDEAERLPLTPAEWAGDYRYYEIRLTLETGLYWYTFAYDGGTGCHTVTRFAGGNGYLSEEGAAWQQTVYDADFSTPAWFSGGLLYQIFPDRFARAADSSAEAAAAACFSDRYIQTDRTAEPAWRQDQAAADSGCFLGNDYYGGNLRGIAEKLDYLASLGVSCLYLNPVFEAHSNHRYNTADYESVDPLLGRAEDLAELCAAAKARGIRVLLDGVFSHTGDDSRYFNRKGRYDVCGAYNSKASEYYGWYNFEEWPDKYRSWWGIDTLPEVSEDNPGFTDFICGEDGVLRRWMRLGVSGWRLDVADELPDGFLDRVRSAVKAENPEALLIGEVWEDASNKISYGVRRRFLLGRQLDSVMNYPFRAAILEFLTAGQSMDFLDAVMTVLENYPKPVVDCLMNHIGTHDTARILTLLGGEAADGRDRVWQSGRRMDPSARAKAVRLLKIAAVLQYTLPGVPSLYYGDEAGMEGYGDPFNRGFFPWGEENAELTAFYRRLGEVRRGSPAFCGGAFVPVSSDAGTVCYIRRGGGEQILVAVNRWDAPAPVGIGAEWDAAEVLFGGSSTGGTLIMPGRGFCLLRLDERAPAASRKKQMGFTLRQAGLE